MPIAARAGLKLKRLIMSTRRGRLTQLRPVLGTLRSSIAYMPSGDRETEKRRDEQPWRRWYKTARWQAKRMSVLVRDKFTCAMCGRIGMDTSKLVADHREPHRGDETLFWDDDNLQTLCKSPCHDKHKQRMEQAFRLGA